MARVLAATVVAGSLVLGVFSACASSDDRPAGGAPKQSVDAAPAIDPTSASFKPVSSRLLPAAARTRGWLDRVQGLARKDPLLSRVLAPNDQAWLVGESTADVLQSGAYRLEAGAQRDALFAATGIAATSPLELTLAPGSGLELRLTRQGARDVPGELERGRLVFADAYPSTDVVVAANVSHVEELLILKDAGAPREFSWDVAVGPGLSELVKEPDGSLVARSREGSAALRIRPARLIDGQGEVRPLDLRWEKPRLIAQVDARGLAYPVLVDPMIESVLWESNLTAGGVPTNGHAAARLAAGGLVYGGEDENGVLATTQRYNTDGSWSTLTPATSPGPLRNHAMAFNGTNVVMFGGHNGSTEQSKTWVWTGTDWSERCTAGMPCASAPGTKRGHAMAFAGSGKALLFGSTTATGNETWEFSGNTWSPKCTACVDGTSRPSARAYAGMAYAGGSSVLLFGGERFVGGQTDETWLWNGTVWSQVCAGCVAGTSKPPAIGRHSMAWDEHRQKVVLFAGRDTNGQTYDDTWEWDAAGDEWIRTASSGPSARYFSALFYDMTSKRAVLFGGTDGVTSEPFVDTHLYHARGGDCTTASDCNTGFCKDGKCCETDCAADCRTCAGANWGICGNVANAEDTDTCSGSETCNGSAVCKLKQGQACTLANGSECVTAQCVDGRCCENACGGACKTCANAQGSCANVAKLSTDNSPACTGTSACDGAGACKKANGQSCGGASECASGFCVDGTCCESSCTDQCKSCNNSSGTCDSNVAKGSADTNSSPTCSGNNRCDGAGVCKKANGQGCGAASECANGFCADDTCCNTACDGACNECGDGSCSASAADSPGEPSCSPYACNGTSTDCPTTCASDSSCASAFYCAANSTCLPDEPVGTACTRAEQCQGNQNCIDGFCCDGACTGACNACSNAKKGAGADGICGAIVDGGTPRAPGCAPGASACLADGKCNGEGACRAFAPNTTPCGAGTVCAGNSVSGQLCDGAGFCDAGGAQQDCAPSKCVAGACTTSCDDASDCDATTGFCAGTVCATKRDDGESCGGPDECVSGNCVDGVCCNNACAGACQTCETGTCQLRAAGAEGAPSCAPFVCDGDNVACPDDCVSNDVCVATYYCKISDNVCVPRENGTPCTNDDQCPEPFCVDGVCCSEACDGQCEHCDATGACVATTGAPVGMREACPGHQDCAGSCDGENREECTGAQPEGTSCGVASCSANIETSSACDAELKCVESTNACQPYVCGETSCLTECGNDDDCQAGFSCIDHVCISAGDGVCNDEGTQLTLPNGDMENCGAFVCRAGECLRDCTTSTDCQSGHVCNTTQGNGVCELVGAAPGSSDDGGCGCRTAGGRDRRSNLAPLALLAGLLWRRRRTARYGNRTRTL